MLATETLNTEHRNLDRYTTQALVDAFVSDQFNAVHAVKAATETMAQVIDAAVPRIRAGGRLLYIGAGTSGRLGLLDCVELHPTFSWETTRSVAVLAGGGGALSEAVEGAEDDSAQGERELLALQPTPNDVVFGIAASGRTPYVLAALLAARQQGALTVAVVNNPDSVIAASADLAVVLNTGPEVISGSTRLKAGTAQKIALNTLSSAIMVRLNKVYGNLMVDLRATNTKLVHRAEMLTAEITGVTQEAARQALQACNYQIKTAVVALQCGVSTEQAQALLNASDGSIRLAIESQTSQ